MEKEYSHQEMIDDGYTTEETGDIFRHEKIQRERHQSGGLFPVKTMLR